MNIFFFCFVLFCFVFCFGFGFCLVWLLLFSKGSKYILLIGLKNKEERKDGGLLFHEGIQSKDDYLYNKYKKSDILTLT